MKIKLFLFAIVFFVPGFVSGEVVISEIMYDVEGSDTGREWIELYNNGSDPVVIKGGSSGDDSWRVFQKSQGGTENNRTISPDAYQGDMTITGGEYVVIAQDGALFKGDWQSYTGKILVSSAMTLANTVGTLGLRLGSSGVPWSIVLYNSELGANGDGKSLQLVGSSWAPNTPTPGASNQIESSTGTGSGTQAPATPPKQVVEKKIKAEVNVPELAFVGVPVNFKAETFGVLGEMLSHGRYFWNFGDGDFRRSSVNYLPEKFTHIYSYPGEYKVTLEYHKNFYSEVPDAFSEAIIKVIASDVIISAIGNEKDFFVEVSNNTGHAGDISGWYLTAGEKNYAFPKNTVLGVKKSLRLSPKITGFSFKDKNKLQLRNSEWDLVFDYGVTLPKEEPKKEKVLSAGAKDTVNSKEEVALEEEMSETLAIEESSVLTASATTGEEGKASSIPVTVFSVLVLGSAGAVYFMRQRQEG